MIVVIMGVTGSGKSTVGVLLARRLGWAFADADDFHPVANIAKMTRGEPLDDADRGPWLAALRARIDVWLAEGRSAVLACSALKRAYREELLVSDAVKLVYLRGELLLIAERVAERQGHFAKGGLLAGQYRDLEEPDNAVTVDARKDPEELVAEICARLGV